MTNPIPELPAPPGVRDYDVNMHLFHTGTAAEGTAIARIVAGSPEHARDVGVFMARKLDEALTGGADPAGREYHVDIDVDVVEVDDTRSAAELTAELVHFRRVLAALATKFPLMVTISEAEYAAADPYNLQAFELGSDRITFLSPATAPTAPQLPPPGPDGNTDPDVTPIEVWRLARARVGEVEIFYGDQWMRLDIVTIDQADLTATVMARGHDSMTMRADAVVVARPATLEGYGSDLPRLATIGGHQLLAADGWWNLDEAEYMGPMAGCYKITVRRGDESRGTTVNRNQVVLIRATPPGWWTE